MGAMTMRLGTVSPFRVTGRARISAARPVVSEAATVVIRVAPRGYSTVCVRAWIALFVEPA
ncbi:hypothetical protein STENM223S_08605 [Streptomyces tendae]